MSQAYCGWRGTAPSVPIPLRLQITEWLRLLASRQELGATLGHLVGPESSQGPCQDFREAGEALRGKDSVPTAGSEAGQATASSGPGRVLSDPRNLPGLGFSLRSAGVGLFEPGREEGREEGQSGKRRGVSYQEVSVRVPVRAEGTAEEEAPGNREAPKEVSTGGPRRGGTTKGAVQLGLGWTPGPRGGGRTRQWWGLNTDQGKSADP